MHRLTSMRLPVYTNPYAVEARAVRVVRVVRERMLSCSRRERRCGIERSGRPAACRLICRSTRHVLKYFKVLALFARSGIATARFAESRVQYSTCVAPSEEGGVEIWTTAKVTPGSKVISMTMHRSLDSFFPRFGLDVALDHPTLSSSPLPSSPSTDSPTRTLHALSLTLAPLSSTFPRARCPKNRKSTARPTTEEMP